MRRWASVLVWSACGQASEPVLVLDGTAVPWAQTAQEWSASRHVPLSIQVDPLEVGHPGRVLMEDLEPGERVHLLASTSGIGPGPCYVLIERCVDLVPPVRFLGSAVADAWGRVEWRLSPPPWMPVGTDMAFQVVAPGGQADAASLSEPVQRTLWESDQGWDGAP